jgi:capsid protein
MFNFVNMNMNEPKTWAANSLSLDNLRSLSQKIHKDNIYINAFTKNFLSLVLSQGINCSFTSESHDKIKKVYDEFAEFPSVRGDEDINEMVRRLLYLVIRDGDVLAYSTTKDRYDSPMLDGESEEIEFNTSIRVGHILASRIKSPTKSQNVFSVTTGNKVNFADVSIFNDNGVVLKSGQIVGYTVSPEASDGKWLFFPRMFGKTFKSVLLRSPIPTGDPDNLRGVPLVAPALRVLDDVTKLTASEVKSQTFKTKLAAQLELSQDMSEEDMKKAKENLSTLLSDVSVNDTNIIVNAPNTTLKAWDSKPNPQAVMDAMIIPLLKFISQTYGVAWEALTKDLSTASGATARAIYQQAFSDTEIWRKQIYGQLLNPMLSNIISSIDESVDETEWQFSVKPFGYLKAKEEYEANRLAVESNQKTQYEVITEQGYTPQEMFKQDEYLTQLARTTNPLYGVNMEEFVKLLELYNNGTLTEAQTEEIFKSYKIDFNKYRKA